MGVNKLIFPLLIVGFVVFSLAPTFYELKRSGDLQPNRQFELVHNFPTDYNFYLSRIREGLEGRWTVVERYTSEPHAGSLIHELYLLMGKVGAWVRVPWGRVGDIYHVARVVLGAALLVAIAEFCKRSFDLRFTNYDLRENPKTRLFINHKSYFILLAFLLAVTASSFPKFVEVNGALRFGGYMAWWSVMDSLQRITFIPHVLAGQALIVFLVISLTSPTVLKSGIYVLMLGVLAFVLGMIFPPGLVFVYAVMGIWVILSGKRYKQWLMPYGAIVMMSAASIMYFGLMTGMYPWKRLVEVDIIRPLPFDYWEYIKAIGPMGPIGLIGLIWAMIKRDRAMFPAVAWVIAWGALLGIFAFVPQQSPLRFSEMIPHVPLGVLTGYLFYTLHRVRAMRFVGVLMSIVLIGVGLFHMYSSYLWQRDFVDHKIRATLPLVPTGSYVMYPLKDFVAAMGYIQEVSKGKGVVLSETTAGNYIPAYIGNTVYAGHDNTVAFETKRAKVKEFFAGHMQLDEASAWLKETRAGYIFFGPQEREDGAIRNLQKIYPFIEEVYRNAHVIVYTIPSW